MSRNFLAPVTFSAPVAIAANQGIELVAGAPSVTTNKLYQVGSVLYWDGATLGGGGLGLSSAITGFSLGTDGTGLAATDTLLQAFQKLQVQSNSKISDTNPNFYGSSIFAGDASFLTTAAGGGVASFANGSSTGYGVFIGAGDATHYALSIGDYGTTPHAAIMGDGSASFDGLITASSGLSIPASKGIAIATGAPGTTTNKLYQVGGALYFNGSTIGGGGSPGGSDTQVQFNSSGSFAGNANFTYASGTGLKIGTDPIIAVGAGSPATLTGLRLQSYDTSNSWIQNNIQNLSTGASASSDWIATANSGTDSTNYVDFGINGSGYSSGSWTVNGALDGYLYSQSTSLAVGTATAGKDLVLFTGGTMAANQRVVVNDAYVQLNVPLVGGMGLILAADAGMLWQ